MIIEVVVIEIVVLKYKKIFEEFGGVCWEF